MVASLTERQVPNAFNQDRFLEVLSPNPKRRAMDEDLLNRVSSLDYVFLTPNNGDHLEIPSARDEEIVVLEGGITFSENQGDEIFRPNKSIVTLNTGSSYVFRNADNTNPVRLLRASYGPQNTWTALNDSDITRANGSGLRESLKLRNLELLPDEKGYSLPIDRIVSEDSLSLLRQVNYIIKTKNPEERPGGNHYHPLIKEEIIAVLDGQLKVALKDPSGESRYDTIVNAGQMVTLRKGIAHALVAETDRTRYVELANMPFDPDNGMKDVVKHEVI